MRWRSRFVSQLSEERLTHQKIRFAPSDIANLMMSAPDPVRIDLALEARALRWVFFDDPIVSELRKKRSDYYCFLDHLWLIEAMLSMHQCRAWYSPPLNAITNKDFPALQISPEWLFATPISSYTSFEALTVLEGLTWCLVGQLQKVPRTAQWFDEFLRLFELARARAMVLCTQKFPAEMIIEEHRADAEERSSVDATKYRPVTESSAGSDDEPEIGEPLFEVRCTIIFHMQSYITSIEREILEFKKFTVHETPAPNRNRLGALRMRLFTDQAELNETTVMQVRSPFISIMRLTPSRNSAPTCAPS